MRPQYTPIFIERFWARVERGGPDDCWLARRKRSRGGHQVITYRIDGKVYGTGAHVVAWEITNGPVPEGQWVLHNCPNGDDGSCCNPAHLWLGTALDNMQDRSRKGRAPTGDTHPSHLHPERLRRGDNHPARTKPEHLARGVTNGNARLDEDRVRQIRHLFASGTDRFALAAIFGVHADTIRQIVSGKTWKHVA